MENETTMLELISLNIITITIVYIFAVVILYLIRKKEILLQIMFIILAWFLLILIFLYGSIRTNEFRDEYIFHSIEEIPWNTSFWK